MNAPRGIHRRERSDDQVSNEVTREREFCDVAREINTTRLLLPNCYQRAFRRAYPENDRNRKLMACGYLCLARATGLEPATT